jgi:hypothetical protein
MLGTHVFHSQASHGAYTFIENKGQWPEKVTFRSDLKSGFLYLEK